MSKQIDKSLLGRERLTGEKSLQKANKAAAAAEAAALAAEQAIRKNAERMINDSALKGPAAPGIVPDWPSEVKTEAERPKGGPRKPQRKPPGNSKNSRPPKEKDGSPGAKGNPGNGGPNNNPNNNNPNNNNGNGKGEGGGSPSRPAAAKAVPAKAAPSKSPPPKPSAKPAGPKTPQTLPSLDGAVKTARPKRIKRAKNVTLPKVPDVLAAPRAEVTGIPKYASRPVGKLRIIPLGGIEEIGKNLTVIEYGNDIIIIDCGIAFPDEDMLGIDLVIPDIAYLIQNRAKVRGIVLTHGHEDHIGALPYVLKQLNVPVYGTRLTLGILKNKLDEAGILNSAKLFQVEFGDVVPLGVFAAEFIRSSHSIADAAMIAIHSPAGVLLHTGDFKIDNTPILGDPIDLTRIAELGQRGVLALMSDSTNAERPGYTMSERKVGETFDAIFKSCTKRIIIATFASNIHRVQQIFDAAHKYGRKVAVSGRSMVNNIQTAVTLGVLEAPPNILIDIETINKYPPEKVVVITTGSQGETMSALYRMAYSDHKKVELGPGDLVVISASPIPGNEKLVSNVINELFKLGAEVIYKSLADIHVSGHACIEEQKMIISLAKPKYFIPVHGEYRHLLRHSKTAREMGIPQSNIIIPQLGRITEVCEESIKNGGTVQSGKVFVDGSGVGDVGNLVLRERKHLSEDGLVTIVAVMKRSTRQLVSGPEIFTRGFIYVREAEKLIQSTRTVATESIKRCEQSGLKDWNAIKTNVKEAVQTHIYAATKRRPMILPIIMEI